MHKADKGKKKKGKYVLQNSSITTKVYFVKRKKKNNSRYHRDKKRKISLFSVKKNECIILLTCNYFSVKWCAILIWEYKVQVKGMEK